jgi:uncharacterized membrane-anchored protein YhcB (DUF1043 family)
MALVIVGTIFGFIIGILVERYTDPKGRQR